ncbi:MAG: flagellar export chaperone FliS [Burkholderiaceae bacterium]|nr:MAG: flagellar export chaperone FliS [Burkholderiaceae bacterium]
MNPMLNQALRAYAKVEVETMIEQASPHKLVLMLFEGAIKSTNQAMLHLQNGAIAEKGMAISRTIRIIEDGLLASLDVEHGGAIAAQLQALYDYMLRRLLMASLRNDIGALQEVAKLLSELRDTWTTIDQQAPALPRVPAEAAAP